MKSGWIKYFLDNNKEVGDDRLVAAGKASWSKGRLSGICAVELLAGDKVVRLSAPAGGRFWQSDNYEMRGPGQHSTLVRRRLEKRIEPGDTDWLIQSNGSMSLVTVNSYRAYGACTTSSEMFGSAKEEGPRGVFKEEDFNKWFVVELDLRTNELTTRISDQRV